ncbi:MAG: Smr/MutS family protein [Acidobacteriota bacterium]
MDEIKPELHVLPIEDSLDLHTFHPKDLEAAVEAYLEEARKRGLREVRLIHGRGKGVARARVARLLARLPYVLRAYEAPPERGGWGATVVELAPEQGEKASHPNPNPRL